jgi:hypothetical protein
MALLDVKRLTTQKKVSFVVFNVLTVVIEFVALPINLFHHGGTPPGLLPYW